MPLDDLMTSAELAAVIAVTEGTLRNWRYLGDGPPYLKIGGRVWYSRSAIDAWLDEQSVSSAVEPVR